MNWHEIRMAWVEMSQPGLCAHNMRLWALMRRINKAGE